MTLPDPSVINEIIEIVLTLPGRAIDQIFFTVIGGSGREPPAIFRLSCLFFLALGILVISYRYRRYLIAWLIGLYALLLTIVTLVQLLLTLWSWFLPSKVRVVGTVKAFQTVRSDSAETVAGDWRSNDCDFDLTREVPRCGPQGKPLKAPFNLRITSANCGSNVENVRQDPSNPNCLLVRERLTGCGTQSIFGIKECKGRGWLDYEISTSTQSETLRLLAEKSVDASFVRTKGLDIDVASPTALMNDQIIYQYDLKLEQDGSVPVRISNENPSNAIFQSDIQSGRLMISLSASARDKNNVR